MTSLERNREYVASRIRHWVEHFKTHGTSRMIASEIAQAIAERGDVMMYGSKKRGEQEALVEQLAQGVALLALCPGGVTFMGEHYDGEGTDCRTAEDFRTR